ncbi:MAG: hypothetical protein Q9211_002065 [Gyalolechia sp. 1 TL-2023]
MSPSSFLVSWILALGMLASIPSGVSAQQSASIFIVNADSQPLVGSIVGTEGVTTTYQIQCPAGTDSQDCGFPGPFTYIKEGSTSIQYSMDYTLVSASIGCSLGGTTMAVCTGSGGGSGAEAAATGAAAVMTEVVTTTLGPDEIRFTQIPITGAMPTAARSSETASTTTSSTTASGGSTSGQVAATPSGSIPGAASVKTRSMVALVGAAAMAAVMI